MALALALLAGGAAFLAALVMLGWDVVYALSGGLGLAVVLDAIRDVLQGRRDRSRAAERWEQWQR